MEAKTILELHEANTLTPADLSALREVLWLKYCENIEEEYRESKKDFLEFLTDGYDQVMEEAIKYADPDETCLPWDLPMLVKTETAEQCSLCQGDLPKGTEANFVEMDYDDYTAHEEFWVCKDREQCRLKMSVKSHET